MRGTAVGNRRQRLAVGRAVRRSTARGWALACALVVLLAAMAGCSSSGGDGDRDRDGSTTTVTADVMEIPDDQVVWQVVTGGGLVPRDVQQLTIPEITIYGDGTVYLQDDPEPSSARAPRGFVTGRVEDRELDTFLITAGASRLFRRGPVDMGTPAITDMSSTSVTAHVEGHPLTVTAYALGAGFDEQLTAAQKERRAVLLALIERSHDLVGEVRPWQPDRVRAVLLGPVPGSASTTPWPGPAPADFPRASGPLPDRCLVIDGPKAAEVYEAARSKDGTDWNVGAEVQRITVTPLLPGQEGCPQA